MKLSSIVISLSLAGLGIVQQISSANALTWTINNLTFSDGGTASGKFDYNNGSYSNINITVNGPRYTGTPNNTNGTYTFTNSDSIMAASSSVLDMCTTTCTPGGLQEYFRLTFASPLGNTVGQTINFAGNTYYGNNQNQPNYETYAVSGSVTAVPFDFSPTEGAALGIPLFIGLGMLRKKKLAQKSAAKKVAELVS